MWASQPAGRGPDSTISSTRSAGHGAREETTSPRPARLVCNQRSGLAKPHAKRNTRAPSGASRSGVPRALGQGEAGGNRPSPSSDRLTRPARPSHRAARNDAPVNWPALRRLQPARRQDRRSTAARGPSGVRAGERRGAALRAAAPRLPLLARQPHQHPASAAPQAVSEPLTGRRAEPRHGS